jgi:O-antigen ligase/polysaccharide polymerase Wzy-like membrane protein
MALRRPALESAVLLALPATILAVACSASWSGSLRDVANPARSLAVIAFCGLALAYARSRRANLHGTRFPSRTTVALLLLACGSVAWSVNPSTTAARAGAFTLLITGAAALAAAVAGDGRATRRVLLAVLAGATLVALIGLGIWVVSPGNALQPATEHLAERFRGVGEDPNTVSMLFALAIPPAALFGLESDSLRARLAAGAAFLLLAGSIVASGSRGALVAACLGLLVFAVTGLRRFAHRAAVAGALAALALGTAVVSVLQEPVSRAEAERLQSPSNVPARHPRDAELVLRLEDEIGYSGGFHFVPGRGLTARSGRLDAWRAAVDEGSRRPAVGYGFGTEEAVFIDRFQRFQGGVPENSFLGLFLQLGGLGVALFVALLAALGAAAVRTLGADRTVAGACLAVLTAGIVLAFVQSFAYAIGNTATLTLWLCAFLPAARAAP